MDQNIAFKINIQFTFYILKTSINFSLDLHNLFRIIVFLLRKAEKKNRCAAGRTVKVKTCCEALTFDKVGREKGLK